MRYENDEIIVGKQEWMVNFFCTGLAVQLLEKYTDKTEQWWIEELSNQANKQYDEILKTNPQQIEEVIKLYSTASGN